MPSTRSRLGPVMALGSAALFGASTPLAKGLLGEGVDPWMLAGLLYLGAGLGLTVMQIVRGRFGSPAAEAPLRRHDLPWLGLVVVTGGGDRTAASDGRVAANPGLVCGPPAQR